MGLRGRAWSSIGEMAMAAGVAEILPCVGRDRDAGGYPGVPM
jgi:hypothetical protein